MLLTRQNDEFGHAAVPRQLFVYLLLILDTYIITMVAFGLQFLQSFLIVLYLIGLGSVLLIQIYMYLSLRPVQIELWNGFGTNFQAQCHR